MGPAWAVRLSAYKDCSRTELSFERDRTTSSFIEILSNSSNAEKKDHRIILSGRNVRAHKVTAIDRETGILPLDTGEILLQPRSRLGMHLIFSVTCYNSSL